MKKDVIVVIDAFSAGHLLSQELRESIECVHVKTIDSTKDIYRNDFLFSSTFTYRRNNFGELISYLNNYCIVNIIAGSEFGVILSDILCSHLGINSNSKNTSLKRRNKFEMFQACKEKGLSVIPQICCSSMREIGDWLEENTYSKYVVKPVDSGGSDDVYICEKPLDVIKKANEVLGKRTVLNTQNDTVLIQKFIDGQEYVVNTVSNESLHYFTEIWKVCKRNRLGRNIYDYDDLINPKEDDGFVSNLTQYVETVNNALGIEYGPGHTEVIVSGTDIYHIETAARLSGAANPIAIREATGSDQVMETINMLLGRHGTWIKKDNRYELNSNARCVHIISNGRKIFDENVVNEFLTSLPSFSNVIFRAKHGDHLRKTVDVLTCPGAFFLVSEDKEEIEKNYISYREWELRFL